MPVNIIIADDHSMVREGLRQLLEMDGDIKIIGEAKDGNDCLRKLRAGLPDVLLLDINMPNMNGLEVLEYIKENKIKVKVIVLTVHNEVEYLIKALNIGINGYMLKDSNSSQLRRAIFSVMEGNIYIQPKMVPYLNQKMVEKDSDKYKIDRLTKRELQILKLLAEGTVNKDIGEKLEISERTVKNHITNVFKKIEVKDRTQAAVFAIRNNLTSIF